MAIILEAAYSKKLGLPNYSSHSYVVSIRTELQDISQVPAESARLYRLLQDSVDKEIQEPGFLPDATSYGMNNGDSHQNGNSSSNGHGPPNGRLRDGIPITAKQLELVNKIVVDHDLDKSEVEDLSIDMFNAGVKQLNKLQASNLIDELFSRYGRKNGNGQRDQSRQLGRNRR